jgi:hypothetical protein
MENVIDPPKTDRAMTDGKRLSSQETAAGSCLSFS